MFTLKRLCPSARTIDQDIGRSVHQVLRAEAEGAADGPGSGIARGLDVHLAVADHDGFVGRCAGLFHQRAQAERIGLF